jgi:SAM-dependent methyltransferase
LGSKPAHFRQEAVLVDMLANLFGPKPHKAYDGSNPPKSIFEAGCGRGRLAYLFWRVFPHASYSAIDVGEAQLAEARRLRPDGIFGVADLTDPKFVGSFVTYDLVVASEVLMHIRPGAELTQAFANLVLLTKVGGYIVTIDWVPIPGDERPVAAYWNFPHNYGGLFQAYQVRLMDSRRTDNQMIFILERI